MLRPTMTSPTPSVLNRAATELERIRSVPKHDGVDFPRSCVQILRTLPGNKTCMDCASPNPEWASVTYGILVCTRCSGRHRSYGVHTSFVRSITMDAWSHIQILAMLEGGNGQLKRFFDRHHMGNTSTRYNTKAALFYRSNLSQHVQAVSNRGVYKGREASRQEHAQQVKQQQQHQRQSTAQKQTVEESTTRHLSRQQQQVIQVQ